MLLPFPLDNALILWWMRKAKQVSIGLGGVEGISKRTAKRVWAVLRPPLVEGVNAYRHGLSLRDGKLVGISKRRRSWPEDGKALLPPHA